MEQWTHKPLVLGSNPSLAMFLFNGRKLVLGLPRRVQANSSLAMFLFNAEVGSGFARRYRQSASPCFYLMAKLVLGLPCGYRQIHASPCLSKVTKNWCWVYPVLRSREKANHSDFHQFANARSLSLISKDNHESRQKFRTLVWTARTSICGNPNTLQEHIPFTLN